MRSIGQGLLVGLAKGLAIGAAFGAVLTYALGWPVPAGSLLGYLAVMASAGTVGIVGGRAPWSEGAWLVAILKAVAGVGAGAFLYWLLATHADAALPAALAGVLAAPGAAEDGSLSWVAYPPLCLAAISAVFGSLVELDHAGDEDEGSAERTSPGAKARRELENAATVGPAATKNERGAPDRTRRERKGQDE
jgi:hypothetical protein